ncbi:hypothetical protein [Ureaplasma urealyticum]|uniref:hypothetical protein n=1 Tax=Ureaplasma urealyticum TaxID=2130 RepID=UPI001F61B6F4|nr:hypothetical protein [Ureaplasma urealyticum]UNT66367.1 hypothetical protein IF687_00775 [Ureaplasma urealyticum]
MKIKDTYSKLSGIKFATSFKNKFNILNTFQNNQPMLTFDIEITKKINNTNKN